MNAALVEIVRPEHRGVIRQVGLDELEAVVVSTAGSKP